MSTGTAVDAETAAAALRAAGLDATVAPTGNLPPTLAMTGTAGWAEVHVPREQARAARRLLRRHHRDRPLNTRRFSPYQRERARTVAWIIGCTCLAGAVVIAAAALAHT